MLNERIYNFNAGPAMLPLEVLQEAQAELLNFHGTGMSILEISHRAAAFDDVLQRAKQDIKDLLKIPESYEVFFMAGGGSLQFACVPYNFLREGTVGAYCDTGSFSDKAFGEAQKVGEAVVVFSSRAQKYNRVPRPCEVTLPERAAYLHITGNNTIEGTEYFSYPETGEIPLIADMSSDILSRPLDVSKFSLIYAGAQKNIGPAGVVCVIARKNFVEQARNNIPCLMDYRLICAKDSLYNTPPVYAIYIVGLVAKWLKERGGLGAMEKLNRQKASLIYAALDAHPEFYRAYAERECRSLMNVTFGLPTEELDKEFAASGAKLGLGGLKGHRSVGGIRASIYNAMPLEGCARLAEFMEDFWKEHR